jgi:hypothetical protein
MGPVVAAIAGATVVAGAAAIADRRRRRRAGIGTGDGAADGAARTRDVVAGVPRAAGAVRSDGHGVRAGVAGETSAAGGPAGGSAPADEDVAAWARAVSGTTGTTGVQTGAAELTGEAVLRLAADTTPIGELSVAGVADAVRHAWSAEGNGSSAGPGTETGAVTGDGALAPPPTPRGAGRRSDLPRRRPASPARGGRWRWALAAGGVAVVLVVALAAFMGARGDGDVDGDLETSSPTGAPDPTDQPTTAPTTVPAPLTAAQAFPASADRLNAAGSFSYAGTVSATDVSHVRPMLWLSVESAVEGQVALGAGRVREVAVAADGRAVETVTDGARVFARRADAREALASLPFELLPGLSGEGPPVRGAALVPTWLASAVGPADAAPDEAGRRRFTATIPAAVMGQIERELAPVDATVLLTVDAAGAPVRVEVTSSPTGPPMHLVFDLSALGAPVDIQPPA